MSEEFAALTLSICPCNFPTQCPCYEDCANERIACQSFANYVRDGISHSDTRGKPKRTIYARIFKGREL